MAVALEQEMRARVVEAEAEVPLAMAEAFRQGNLGIMDYYHMKNVQADTDMREAIAEGEGGAPPARGDNPVGAMRSLRLEQILLLLAFVLVPLLNLLVGWLRRRVREQRRPEPTAPRGRSPWRARGGHLPAMPPTVRVVAPAPNEGPRKEARRETPPAPRPRPGRRRAAPLGGRAAVRRAIVAMVILGPCRGLEEPPPSRPVGSLQQGTRRR